MLLPITAAMTAAFIAIHLFIGRLKWLDVLSRHRWLSFSGGVAVSYVFLHVLPDLGLHQQHLVALGQLNVKHRIRAHGAVATPLVLIAVDA